MLCATIANVHVARSALHDEQPARTWNTADGMHKIDAVFVGKDDDAVQLRKADGKVISVPIKILTVSDQQYLSEQVNSAGSRILVKSSKELEREANKRRSAQDAVLLYELFLTAPNVSDDEKEQARKRLAHWQGLAKQGAVHVGQRWINGNEYLELQRQERTCLADAKRLIEVEGYLAAEDKLKDASKVNPDGMRADFILGVSYALIGRNPAKAESHFEESVRRGLRLADVLSPIEKSNLVSVLNNLAIAEVRLKKYDDAIRHWKQAVEIGPTTPEISQNLGRLIYLKDNSRLVRLTPGSFKVLAGLYGKTEDKPFEKSTGWLYMMLRTEDEPAKKTEPDNKPEDKKPLAPVVVDRASLPVVGMATAFAVGPSHLLTNYHVVEGADLLSITHPSDAKQLVAARVAAVAPEVDLALLVCDQVRFEPIKLSSRLPRLASDVVVLGFPAAHVLGLNLKSTRGSISGHPDPSAGNLLLYDAVTNPGNSGGPVCDQTGNAVAIHSQGKGALVIGNLNAGKLGAGVPSSAAVEFLRPHLPNLVLDSSDAKLDWADLVEKVGRSTARVLVHQDPLKNPLSGPLNQLKQQAPEKKNWKAFEDPWCMVCNGHGKFDCQACIKGTVSVKDVQVTGINTITGQPMTRPYFQRKECRACNGHGSIACRNCRAGIDPLVTAN